MQIHPRVDIKTVTSITCYYNMLQHVTALHTVRRASARFASSWSCWVRSCSSSAKACQIRAPQQWNSEALHCCTVKRLLGPRWAETSDDQFRWWFNFCAMALPDFEVHCAQLAPSFPRPFPNTGTFAFCAEANKLSASAWGVRWHQSQGETVITSSAVCQRHIVCTVPQCPTKYHVWCSEGLTYQAKFNSSLDYLKVV